jgi:hypothetical protein
MRFQAEQRFPGVAPRVVAALLVDPEFQSRVELPDLSLPEVVEHRVDGDDAVLRLRYGFVGRLDPVAVRLLGGKKLTWVQELRLDVVSGRGTLQFAAEADPNRLYGDASVVIDGDASETRRRFDGELVVKAPVVGGMAERRIVPGLVRRLDVEAEAVRQELQRSES